MKLILIIARNKGMQTRLSSHFSSVLIGLALLVLFVMMGSSRAAELNGPTDSERTIVHLLDYLSKDYGSTVKNGKISNASEYAEQVEFAKAIEESARTSKTLKTAGLPGQALTKSIEELNVKILSKRPGEEVAALAIAIQKQAINLLGISQAPAKLPNLMQGQKLYADNCVSCHGVTGHGDGPAGKSLEPKPADFFNAERMNQLSAFQAFNTIHLGVAGTAMVAHSHLSTDDTWNLAFYILSLRHGPLLGEQPATEEMKSTAFLARIASLTESELSQSLGEEAFKKLRTTPIRIETTEGENRKTFAVARTHLASALSEYKTGNVEAAKNFAIRAYLEGIEVYEPELKANDSKSVPKIESAMAAVRGSIQSKEAAPSVERSIQAALETLQVYEPLLAPKALSPIVIGVSSASIVLREGFEAVFIIIALLGALAAMGMRSAAIYIHGGWIFALLLGFLCWPFSNELMKMSGASREMMEGTLSLVAVVVLIAVGFWLHQRSEAKRWQAFLKSQVQDVVQSNRRFALAVLSFIAVFREAIETVLFLRALTLESGTEATRSMAIGVILAIVATILIAFAMLRYSKRFPVAKLFSIAAGVMAFTAILLTGKGIHSLQEAGRLGITSIGEFRADFLGLYPSLETLVAQGAIVAIISILWLWTRSQSHEIVAQ